MAYSINPNLIKARRIALLLILEDKLPLNVVARKCGVHRTTVWRWLKKWQELNKKSEDDVIRIFFATEKTEEDLFFIIFDPLKLLDKNNICNFLSTLVEVDKLPQEKENTIKTEKPVPRNLNILLVEDDYITRTMESKILSKYGHCCLFQFLLENY
jgi:hypothetical protein